MPRFKFKISELEYRTLDAFDLDDALERAGIRSDFLAKYIFSLRKWPKLCLFSIDFTF